MASILFAFVAPALAYVRDPATSPISSDFTITHNPTSHNTEEPEYTPCPIGQYATFALVSDPYTWDYCVNAWQGITGSDQTWTVRQSDLVFWYGTPLPEDEDYAVGAVYLLCAASPSCSSGEWGSINQSDSAFVWERYEAAGVEHSPSGLLQEMMNEAWEHTHILVTGLLIIYAVLMILWLYGYTVKRLREW